MTDKNDYRRLLGERIARAHLLQNEVEPPAAEDIACWKRLALAKKQERKRRLRNMATLASVLAVVCCASLVPLFHIPDAQAGKDSFVDVEDFRDAEESMRTDTYREYAEVPQDVKDEFYIFDNLPEDFSVSEIKVVTIGENKKCETLIENKDGNTLLIIQRDLKNTQTYVDSDYVEKWQGIDVYVAEYSDSGGSTDYMLSLDNKSINVIADKDIEKRAIQKIIQEAVF